MLQNIPKYRIYSANFLVTAVLDATTTDNKYNNTTK